MPKPKQPPFPARDVPKRPLQKNVVEKPAPKSYAVRETIESIVIAFVLAFLFRTFEAEAFVIPTGSMAPTLMGRHKDVECPKCGYRYQVSASEERPSRPQDPPSDCIAGMCPMCHYVLPMLPKEKLPVGIPEQSFSEIDAQTSYNGDRILVNKYKYTFSDPQRWDVVVFKFPGGATDNYIKRLVGLPGESLRIYHGDLFTGNKDAKVPDDFKIARKPPEKVLAMRQLVHDSNYDPVQLDSAGWPLRWQPFPQGGANGWQVEKKTADQTVEQNYSVDGKDPNDVWLRYHHYVPDYSTWQSLANTGTTNPQLAAPKDRLICDSNPYNGREDRDHMFVRHGVSNDTLEVDKFRQGIHWVGDLMVEADVKVESSDGQLVLDLVEGGRHFNCRIDVKTGEAKLSAEGDANYAPTAKTKITGPGNYEVGFANFDDQLLLWIDGKVIAFDKDTAYDAKQVFGDGSDITPKTSATDPGDFAPVGIGSRGAKLTVNRLKVWRDIYYIADDLQRKMYGDRWDPVTDFEHPVKSWLTDLPSDPSTWDNFKERNEAVFRMNDKQLFVMGDNSAESSDARLWSTGQPDARYLERRLLIGKALCVYWPHSWNRVTGTPVPFPLFPNFGDMRLVR